MRIAFCTSLEPPEHAAWLQALRALCPEDAWHTRWAKGEHFDAAVVAQPPVGALEGLQGLRLIQSLWAGVDRLLTDSSLPTEVPLARMVDPSMTAAMAETAVWAVLSLHRRFFEYAGQQQRCQWHQWPQRRAQDVPVLVLGAGAMGLGVAHRLSLLGYPVGAWRRGGSDPQASGTGHPGAAPASAPLSTRDDAIPVLQGTAALDAALARCEILINLLPLTPHTRGFLNARLFCAMPAGSAVVNFGRGGHLVEADLLAALDQGRLQRAVLDVFGQEPLPSDHPFWQHPRVTVLPHVAALTDLHTAAQVVARNLQRLKAGQPVLHLVDRARGY